MKEKIKIKNLHKSYGEKQKKVQALNGLSLSIEEGSFTVIMGKSGSGKSTLLHIIGGLMPFDTGTVKVDEIMLENLNNNGRAKFRREKISFIYQFFNLLNEFTAEENIKIPFELNNKRLDIDFMNKITNELGIEKILSKYPMEMSGGEQQRVAIAQALLSEKGLILADEPTGNLDRRNRNIVFELLRKMQKRYNQTIVMVTHDIDLAKQADRIIYIEDGRVINDE